MYKPLYTQGTIIGAQTIDKWTPTNLSPNVDADGHGSKFVHNIIKQVLQEVNQTPLDVAWYSVGGDTHVKYTELLLQNEIDEVHMIGIGGIGKNTSFKMYLQTN